MLTYEYGANQEVAPMVDSTGDVAVASLLVRRGSGITPMILLTGTARFDLYGTPREVQYPDGTPLDCRGK